MLILMPFRRPLKFILFSRNDVWAEISLGFQCLFASTTGFKLNKPLSLIPLLSAVLESGLAAAENLVFSSVSFVVLFWFPATCVC